MSDPVKPVAAPVQPQAVPASAPAKTTKKKKGGCLKGCLIFLLIFLLLIGAATALIFKVPQRMGWMKSGGARLTAQTPERLSAAEIVVEAETKGFKSEGVQVFVFPKPDSEEAVLFASYDFSKKGVTLSQFGSYHPVVGTLVLLGGGEKAKEYAITHVGAEFLDEQGKLLVSVAASTADIRDLQAGKMTEEQFKQRLGKSIDMPNYINRAVVPF